MRSPAGLRRLFEEWARRKRLGLTGAFRPGHRSPPIPPLRSPSRHREGSTSHRSIVPATKRAPSTWRPYLSNVICGLVFRTTTVVLPFCFVAAAASPLKNDHLEQRYPARRPPRRTGFRESEMANPLVPDTLCIAAPTGGCQLHE